MNRADERMDRADEATRKLVQAGILLVNKWGRATKELWQEVRALNTKTDRILDILLHPSRNGRPRRNPR